MIVFIDDKETISKQFLQHDCIAKHRINLDFGGCDYNQDAFDICYSR